MTSRTPMNRSDFAARLIACRQQTKLTQKAAAESVGVRQQTLAYWETGRSQPAAEHLHALAQLYSVSTDYLVGLCGHAGPLEPNAWVLDLDVLDVIRNPESPLPREWDDGGEAWAFPVPRRPRIVSSVELAPLRTEVERIVRSKRRKR